MTDLLLKTIGQKTTRRYDTGPTGYNVDEDTARCIASVPYGKWFRDAQCERKRGHGPRRLYCKQHGKMAEVKIRAEDKMRAYLGEDKAR